MKDIIYNYQALIGSFFGIIFPIVFWYIKTGIDDRGTKAKNQKEIENIFLQASRECEESAKNLRVYVVQAREKFNKKSDGVSISLTPKFSRVYANEERLFTLKSNQGFLLSQQVDIAISAAKFFNGWLDNIERIPELLFNNHLRMLELGLHLKDEHLEKYRQDTNSFLAGIEKQLGDPLFTVQKHLLRPVAAVAVMKSSVLKEVPGNERDNIIDSHAQILLAVIKKDLN